MRVYDSKDLIGRTVIDAAGRALGEVDGVLLDIEEWKVAALTIKLRREAADVIGVRRGRFRAATIAIPTHLVLGAGDTVVLKVTAAGLRQKPAPEPSPDAGPH